MPATFFPFTSKSLGQRISTLSPVSRAQGALGRHAGHQGKNGSRGGREGRTKYDGDIDAAGFFRVPRPAKAPAAGRLFFGHHHRPVLRALLREIQGGGVRRVGPEVVDDGVPNLTAAQFAWIKLGTRMSGIFKS